MSTVATAPALAGAPVKNIRTLIIATSIGNALEWYDLIIYGYFAVTISKVFFPTSDPTVGILLTFGTFAISYLSRPLGAVVLGGYADRVGRKSAMLMSILLMVVGTAMIVVTPGYATIGIAAPILVVIARLIQGFSAGGEFGSSTAFLVEHAPERRGFIASWQFASQGVSTMLAALFGVVMSVSMSAETLASWGWRVPFLVGLAIGPIGLYIRRNCDEPPRERSQDETTKLPVGEIVSSQLVNVVVAIGALAASTAVNYLLLYMPTFAVRELGLGSSVSFVAVLLGSVMLVVVTPIVGHISDIIGRTRLMFLAIVLMMMSFYPCFVVLTAYAGTAVLIAVVVWLAFLKSLYYGALPALMSELFPSVTRATGLALSYNIGVPAFGGLAPLAMAALVSATGSKLAPSYFLTVIAILSLAALIAARRRFGIR